MIGTATIRLKESYRDKTETVSEPQSFLHASDALFSINFPFIDMLYMLII